MIGPIIQGSTRPIWSWQILQDDNSSFNLTGSSFAGVLYDRMKAGSKITLTGAFNTTSSTGGQFTYTPVSADVTVPGEWEIEITITIGGQPTIIRDHVTIVESYT